MFFSSANAPTLESLVDHVATLMVFGGTVFYLLMRDGFRMNAPETAGFIAEEDVALSWLGLLISMLVTFTSHFARDNFALHFWFAENAWQMRI